MCYEKGLAHVSWQLQVAVAVKVNTLPGEPVSLANSEFLYTFGQVCGCTMGGL